MTHQTATVVVELRTRRNATDAPGADGPVRPIPARNGKRRPAYIGLLATRSRTQWKDLPRQKVAGGMIRLMTPDEIDGWYERLAAIKAGRDQDYHVVRKPPLLDDAFERNQRADDYAAKIRQQPSRDSEMV